VREVKRKIWGERKGDRR
jgi:hypothetical protein